MTVPGLDPLRFYQVKKMDGQIITSQTGADLAQKGFEIESDKPYDGQLFEIVL